MHGSTEKAARAYNHLNTLFKDLESAAPQLTAAECRSRISANIIETSGYSAGFCRAIRSPFADLDRMFG